MTLHSQVSDFVDACSRLLTPDSLREVRHFLDHDEFEVAFEGLILELIQLNVAPSNMGVFNVVQLATQLGLKEDSVLSGDFWPQFESWVKRYGA